MDSTTQHGPATSTDGAAGDRRSRTPRRAGAGPWRRLSTGAVLVGSLAGGLTCFAGTATALAGPPASTAASTSSSPSALHGAGAVLTTTQERDVRAFYAAGYGYTDALDLAVLWSSPDVSKAKVAGGAKLLAGHHLPFAPGQGVRKTYTDVQDAEAFALSGYGYTDALDLAVLWSSPDLHKAKVTAGAKLLAGQDLPKIPKTFTDVQDAEAFALSGYTYSDALDLAAVWASPTVYRAKVKAGAELLAGQDLPKIPKTFTAAQDVNAFHASGYTHADAVHLAHLWHSGSVRHTEVKAGAVLLAGGTLPIAP